jgi:hypothetical protein
MTTQYLLSVYISREKTITEKLVERKVLERLLAYSSGRLEEA